MKSGMFPGQQEALRELARKGLKYEGVARRQRRMFLGFCLGTVAAASGAFWAGKRSALATEATPRSAPEKQVHPSILEQVGIAHELAIGPEANLRDKYALFMLVHDGIGGDAITWLGVQRLACSCTRADDEMDSKISKRVLASVEANPPTDASRKAFDLLTPRLRALHR